MCFFNSNLITFLSSSQNTNNGEDFCPAKYRSSVSNTDICSVRCFQKVMLIFTIMHFPGPWEPTADLAGILYESGCLRSPVKCIPSLNFTGNEPCLNITNSSGYLNAKSHQTSGQGTEVKQAGSVLAGFITSLSLMHFNTLWALGRASSGRCSPGELGLPCPAQRGLTGESSHFGAMRRAKLIRPLNWHQ